MADESQRRSVMLVLPQHLPCQNAVMGFQTHVWQAGILKMQGMHACVIEILFQRGTTLAGHGLWLPPIYRGKDLVRVHQD